jgi:hypothetical protein
MRPVIALLLFATRVATAEPAADEVVAPPGMSAPAPPAPTATEDLKDPHIALLLAVAGSLAPIAIVGAAARGNNDNKGTLIGLTATTVLFLPSAGHWYSGRFLTPGMITRAIGLSVAAFGLLMLVGSEGDSGANVFVAGGIVTVSGAVLDIATAPHEAEAYNDAHRVRVKPVAMHFKTGGYGVGLGGTF